MWTKRRLFQLITVLVLALLGYWLSRDDAPGLPAAEPATASSDYYLRDFSVLSSAEDGRWQYRLESSEMQHLPEGDRWEFQAPRMTLFSADGPDWHGRAESGEAFADSERIELHGEVVFERPAGESDSATTITTRDVRLRPADDYAETDAPVTITQDNLLTRGTGARVFLAEQRYELYKVDALYQPQPR